MGILDIFKNKKKKKYNFAEDMKKFEEILLEIKRCSTKIDISNFDVEKKPESKEDCIARSLGLLNKYGYKGSFGAWGSTECLNIVAIKPLDITLGLKIQMIFYPKYVIIRAGTTNANIAEKDTKFSLSDLKVPIKELNKDLQYLEEKYTEKYRSKADDYIR